MLLLASWRAATSLALLSRRENSSVSEFLSHMDLWTNQHLGFNYTPVKTHFIKLQQMANAAHMAEFWNVISFVLTSYFITSKSETGCMPKITNVPCQISDLKDKRVLTASLISSYLFPEHCGFVMFSASAYSMLCLCEVHHAWIRKTFDIKLTPNYPRKLLKRKSPSGGLIRFTCNRVSQCGSFKWQNTSNNYNLK